MHPPPAAQTTADLAAERERIEARSAAFKKELGLGDLVLTQILYVVGIAWVGTAAKLGRAQLVFWLLAMLLFYIPQAAVVIHMSRRMPLEGGLYQWAKLGLGELMAFLVAWNLWLYAIVLLGAFGVLIATNLSYAVGPAGAWMASSKWFIAGETFVILGALVVTSVIGLGVSKWVHNVGSVALMGAFAVLIALPFVRSAQGAIPAYHPFAAAFPAVSLFSLNVFGKLAVGALSGFEYVAVLAGETRDPKRAIGRSVVIAAPVIAIMFILGTSSVLAFVPQGEIDLIGPIPQVFRLGFREGWLAAYAVPVVILMITSRVIGNSSVVFTTTSRMPMVAGWDHLLPRWFTRLHPRYRTPVNSILFVAVVAFAFTLAGMAGVGEQEAFQLLDNAAGIFYGLTYLVLFALPLAPVLARASPVPAWLRVASVVGFCTTLLYVTLSIFPIIEVTSWVAFAAKVGGVVVAANAAGLALYLAAERRRAAASAVRRPPS